MDRRHVLDKHPVSDLYPQGPPLSAQPPPLLREALPHSPAAVKDLPPPLMEYLNQLHQHICYLTRVRAPGTRSTSTSSDFLAPILQRSKIMDPSIAPSPLNRSVIPSNQRFRQIHRVCRYPSCGIGVHLL